MKKKTFIRMPYAQSRANQLEAQQKGGVYFIGRSCVNGHGAETGCTMRLSRNGKCCECDKAANKRYRSTANGRAIRCALQRNRRAVKLNRTPAWADRDKIKNLYIEAALLTESTGIQMHVDHIVPMQGELVSGLHVEYNLRVIPASENQAKFNRFE